MDHIHQHTILYASPSIIHTPTTSSQENLSLSWIKKEVGINPQRRPHVLWSHPLKHRRRQKWPHHIRTPPSSQTQDWCLPPPQHLWGATPRNISLHSLLFLSWIFSSMWWGHHHGHTNRYPQPYRVYLHTYQTYHRCVSEHTSYLTQSTPVLLHLNSDALVIHNACYLYIHLLIYHSRQPQSLKTHTPPTTINTYILKKTQGTKNLLKQNKCFFFFSFLPFNLLSYVQHNPPHTHL